MRKQLLLLVASLSAAALVGCNVGNAPEPMSANEVKSEVEKLTPEQQIDWINRSPMPPAEKQQRINEIKAKAGMAQDGGGTAPPGAPNVPAARS